MTSERDLGRHTQDQVDDFYRTGLWTDENFTDLLLHRVADMPNKVFLTDGTLSVTFAELFESSQRLALGLRRHGLRPGDRVAVQLPNWAEFVQVVAALSRIGVVTVPIMPIYRRGEVAHVVADASVKMVIGPYAFKGFEYPAMYEAIRADSPHLESIVAVRAPEAERNALLKRGIKPLDHFLVHDVDSGMIDVELDFRTHPDDCFVIVYTSGTTSRPKGCVHSFNTYASGARALTVAFGQTSDDVSFGPSPITHTTGLVTSVLIPMMVGAATHVMTEWSPTQGLADIAKYRCTTAVTATTFLHTLLLAADDNPDADLSSLRVWVCAGSPIPAATVKAATEMLPDTRVLSLYGRSENLSTTTCQITDNPRRALVSDGAALPGADVKVVDLSGHEVPRGVEGDIAYRGPSHMIGYLNRPGDTAELFTSDGYSRSGDLGVMDDDGFVRVTGRTKDIVIRGGMNISVREIEDKLADHPGIVELAVVGMPDVRLGEKVCCFVVAKGPEVAPTVEDLRAYLVDRGVAIQKTPERVIAVAQLPMTATGKIQKHILRKQIAAAADHG